MAAPDFPSRPGKKLASSTRSVVERTTSSPSSRRRPGPIIPGCSYCDDRGRPSPADTFRGMGPGLRRDDGAACGVSGHLICPSSAPEKMLSTGRRKNICLFRISDSAYGLFRSAADERGVTRRHERGAECGGRAGAVRRAAVARTVKACGPGAPKAWRQVGDDASHRGDDGGNRQGSPRRARYKP